jgi:uncharacterized protein (DUF433 family)
MATKMIAVKEGAGGRSYVIKGTRVRVSDIAGYYTMFGEQLSQEGQIIEEISKSLPHLTSAQIKAAVSFWRGHRDEIDAEIAEEERLAAQFASER